LRYGSVRGKGETGGFCTSGHLVHAKKRGAGDIDVWDTDHALSLLTRKEGIVIDGRRETR
jgi:phage terminase Nu1 subunit (DNA packaging protein)